MTDKKPLISNHESGTTLHSPTKMPLASSFLWNPVMMLHVNCRGYATSQFMQPEPAKYAHAPNMEAKTFMQPEQPYFTHHPGRFFYIKDLVNNTLFSSPYEPVRSQLDYFEFTAAQDHIKWKVIKDGIQIDTRVSLSKDSAVELWSATITNLGDKQRLLSFSPYFPVGYMSWMNQSGSYDPTLQSIICKGITPYQKYHDYFKNKDLKDLTFLIAEHAPDSWEVRQSTFEGEGGLHNPSALEQEALSNSASDYELPVAAMQYKISLNKAEQREFRFAFGPAKDKDEIASIRKRYFGDTNNAHTLKANSSFNREQQGYRDYIAQPKSAINITTPDKEFDYFVNHWLGRQIFYHGDVNRLSTDPQTRNYLQDNMGMAYVNPSRSREAFILALSQQSSSGAMPDGILLNDEAELKYINNVPHMDHCVWLPVCISAYLDETNDYALLDEKVGFADSGEAASVYQHICRAMRWLFSQRDHRDLNYIAQGDWCDPMNMVGYKGKGVSSWLSLATAYSSKLWAGICITYGQTLDSDEFLQQASTLNKAVNKHLWCDKWYARGITDDDILFGIPSDNEGRIFLNPQSWSMLSGAASQDQERSLLNAIAEQLETPFGVQMLAPSFTRMREDIGRVTQKHPGTAENGSIYNHASAFYAYALYQQQHNDRAFDVLRQMIPSSEEADLIQRGQMPVFIPNYYRGAYDQLPRTAGRSSQLFNTGTVHWFYRCLIDGMFGVKGNPEGLSISPQLPNDWSNARIKRPFRGAEFDIHFILDSSVEKGVILNNQRVENNVIKGIEKGQHYHVTVYL